MLIGPESKWCSNWWSNVWTELGFTDVNYHQAPGLQGTIISWWNRSLSLYHFLVHFLLLLCLFMYYMLCIYVHVRSHTRTRFVWITLFYNNAFRMLRRLESKWCSNCHQVPWLQGIIIPHDERAFPFFYHFLLLLFLFYLLHVMYLCTCVRVIFYMLFPRVPYLIFNIFYL